MEGFADLLSDAFSETSVPSLPDGDLDFENLNFDESLEEEQTEDVTTKKDDTLLQEAADETLCSKDDSDKAEYAEDDVKEEEEEEEENYTSSDEESEQEGSVSGGDEDDEEAGAPEEPGDLWMSVCCSEKFTDDNEEHRVFAEGQPAAPQGPENPQVRNKEQSDEEVSYIEHGSEMKMVKEQGSEEEDDSSECEGTEIQNEEKVLSQCFESPYDDNATKATSDSPCISMQSLQDLVEEVDSEEYVEKMKDFSGDDHQEAGESFADYPSDFSSIEYVEDGGKNQLSKSEASPGSPDCGSNAEVTQRDSPVEPDKMEEYLYSRDLEEDADQLSLEKDERRENLTGYLDEDEARESDSYSSSDNEEQLKRNIEELLDYDPNKQQDDTQVYGGSSSGDHHVRNNMAQPSDFLSWDFDVLKTDNLLSEYFSNTEVEMPPSDLSQAEGSNSYSVVQQDDPKTTSPSYCGSVDDSFFFTSDPDASEVTEEGQMGDDEDEGDRNWEQEQERIKAFYRFYDDCDEENGREERQTKVQFCADPLSQVNYYETESDRDSLSSSTDMESSLSDELMMPDSDTMQMKPDCEPADTELPESLPDFSTTQTSTRQNKRTNILKLMLKMCVVTVMGLLMFWLITDEGDWLSDRFFF